MIPMVNLKAQYAEIEAGMAATIANTAFILGANGRAFETEAANYLGVQHAIGVASGTDALHLALLAAGVGHGDEVITTAFTFIATAEAIKYVGAKPIFVDIDPQTFNIDPNAIKAAINSKTKAILPVHLFGQPADLTAIQRLCKQYNLTLIEDCAQAFGADIQGQKVGSIGDIAGYSFFPSKNLGAFGDAGLVATNSDTLAAKIKQLRNHGSSKRYQHEIVGFNSRLDDIQAVVLRAKLKRIDKYNQARRDTAALYSHLLNDLDAVITPFVDNIGTHVYHQYTLLSPYRDVLLADLQAQQIGCAVYYPIPLHQQPVFKAECDGLKLPHTETVASQCISLPICANTAIETVEQVVSIIKTSLQQAK